MDIETAANEFREHADAGRNDEAFSVWKRIVIASTRDAIDIHNFIFKDGVRAADLLTVVASYILDVEKSKLQG